MAALPFLTGLPLVAGQIRATTAIPVPPVTPPVTSAVLVASTALAVQLGHSNVANGSGTAAGAPVSPPNGGTAARSVLEQIARATGQRIIHTTEGNFALGGDTTAPSNRGPGMLARLDAVIARAKALGAGLLYFDGLGNNIGAIRQSPGADGTTAFSPANTVADVLQIWQACRAAGLVFVGMNLQPRGETPGGANALGGADLQTLFDTRAAIGALDDAGLGRNWFDPAPFLVADPAAFTLGAAFHAGDWLHYNGLAATTLAVPWAAWALNRGFLPASPIVVPGLTALPGALNGAPNMDGTGAVASGWLAPASGGGLTIVPSLWVDPASGLRWQRLDVSGTPGADATVRFRRVLANPAAVAGGRLSGICEYRVPAGRAGGLAAIGLSLRQSYTTSSGNGAFLPAAGQSGLASDRVGGAETAELRGVMLTEPCVPLPADPAQGAITAVTGLEEQVMLAFKAGVAVDATVMVRGFDVRWNRSLA